MKILNNAYLVLFLFFMFLSMVIPNALHIQTAVFFVLTFVFSFLFVRIDRNLTRLLIVWLVNSIVTIIYIMVGLNNGKASSESFYQVIIVYIISPLMWIILCRGAISFFGSKKMIEYILIMSFLSCLSVAVFYYLHSVNSQYVSFFISDPNINFSDGVAAMTLHVYGSLIFFTGSIFASPMVIRNIFLRCILMIALVVVCMTSGRSALLLSLFFSIFLFFIFSISGFKNNFYKKFLIISLFLILFLILSALLLESIGIDIFLTIELFFVKILSFGGTERILQLKYLFEGIFDHFGLGAGHGVGVDYVRNYNYPWRYELLWVALMYRVGIIGALVYSFIFVYYMLGFMKLFKNKRDDEIDRFMFGGFICSMIASFTNPYIEGFMFQWMFIMPIVYYFSTRISTNRFVNSFNDRQWFIKNRN
jgi:hypothetical protein